MIMKKVLTIVALALVGLIGASVITLAFVKTDYSQLTTSNITDIVVYYGTEEAAFSEANEEFDVLLEKFAASEKETILSSLFQGAYSNEADATVEKLSWTFSKSSDTTYLRFVYDANETYPVIQLNGENYIDETLTTDDQTVEYSSVYVEVENNSTLTTITAYFIQTLDNESSTSSNYRISYVAQQSDLYDYIVSLSEDGLLI